MKVAIVHDILLSYGGAERDLEEFLAIFPSAEIFTLYFNRNDERIRSVFGRKNPKTSFLQSLPYLYRLDRFFSVTKIFSWIYFYRLDLSSYDLVISISGSYNSKFLRKVKPGRHVCYLLTPPKFLYEEQSELNFIKKFPFNVVFFPLMNFLRYIDRKSAACPDVLLAQSQVVRDRVKRDYALDSQVVYPPVNLKFGLQYKKQRAKEYFLFHSRLVQQKGAELVIKTCTKYNLPLFVVGEGHLKKKLEKFAGNSIFFFGRVPDKDLPKFYRKAIALLYCATDEDFGIVPVEAMAFGVPVIAFKSGGVTETVIHGQTGLFFNKFSDRSLHGAIKRFKKLKIDPKRCIQQAQKFDRQNFQKSIIKITHKVLN